YVLFSTTWFSCVLLRLIGKHDKSEQHLRPGFAAREYIEGKRIKFFNFLTLLVVVIGLDVWLGHLLDAEYPISNSKEFVIDFITNHPQQVVLLLAPALALVTLLYFRRLRLNYTEHLIPALFILIIATVIDTFGTICDWAFNTDLFGIYITFFLILGYAVFLYYQFTKGNYTIAGFIWRIVASLLSFWLFVMLVGMILYFLTKKS
ncbi:MAG: DUF3667 domain-containing protein, partial [Chitinophagaceae bacterium]